MTDIVERLRSGFGPTDRSSILLSRSIETLSQAADEIERLRNGIRHALSEIEDGGPKALKYAAQELRIALGEKGSD